MKKYVVRLTEEEREQVNGLIRKGKGAAQTLLHARILLKADSDEGQPGWTDEHIREALDVSIRTISRVRERFVEEGVNAALERKAPAREYRGKLDGEQEAHLVALVCSPPPDEASRWTLRLLASKIVRLGYVQDISHETIRQTLKKMNLSPG